MHINKCTYTHIYKHTGTHVYMKALIQTHTHTHRIVPVQAESGTNPITYWLQIFELKCFSGGYSQCCRESRLLCWACKVTVHLWGSVKEVLPVSGSSLGWQRAGECHLSAKWQHRLNLRVLKSSSEQYFLCLYKADNLEVHVACKFGSLYSSQFLSLDLYKCFSEISPSHPVSGF